jgi:hypothetical protein
MIGDEMMTKQVDFSRVPNGTRRVGNETVSIDTRYIQSFAHFETTARVDIGQRGAWTVLEVYTGRDQALTGHHKWAKDIRENGFPATDADGTLSPEWNI